MRESYIFYASFYEAIQELSNDDRLTVYDAITKYSLTGEISDLKGTPKAIMALVKPQIVANQKRYENGCRGGRPKAKVQTKTRPKVNQRQTILEPNDNDNDNVNANDIPRLGEFPEITIDEITKAVTPIAIPTTVQAKITPGSCDSVPVEWLFAVMRNKGEAYANLVIRTFYDQALRPSEVWHWLARFTTELISKDELYKTLFDYKPHFINWLKIQLKSSVKYTDKNTKHYVADI